MLEIRRSGAASLLIEHTQNLNPNPTTRCWKAGGQAWQFLSPNPTITILEPSPYTQVLEIRRSGVSSLQRLRPVAPLAFFEALAKLSSDQQLSVRSL